MFYERFLEPSCQKFTALYQFSKMAREILSQTSLQIRAECPVTFDKRYYLPGEQPKGNNLIKLNTNENPYGPSPHVLQALELEAKDTLRLYPDPNGEVLQRAIAEYFQLKIEQVFLGNGSDEVLAHIFQGLLKHEHPILFPDITYGFYPVYCRLYEIEYQEIHQN